MRSSDTYRGWRRNDARKTGTFFSFPHKVVRQEAPPVRANCRDRSAEAEKARDGKRIGTIDFCNERGLSLLQVQHKVPTVFEKKPRQGTAAKRRRAPFADRFDAERMAAIRTRHVHPRCKRRAV